MTITREYASPVDTASYGDYQFVRQPGDDRPLYRFGGRIAASASATGTESWPAEPGRYHLYAGWFCPWSQRITIAIALHGLCDTIGVSYLDDSRDGRGWAFRERRGADPVNGFTLLREAYQATDPGFDGHISTPALWDRKQRRLVSNDYRSLGLDIATEFPAYGDPAIDSYPVEHRAEIDELDRVAVDGGIAVGRELGRDVQPEAPVVVADQPALLAIPERRSADVPVEAGIGRLVGLAQQREAIDRVRAATLAEGPASAVPAVVEVADADGVTQAV